MAGELSNMLLATFFLGILLIAMANITGGFTSAFGATAVSLPSDPSKHDLAYLNQSAEVSQITGDLQSKIQNSNSSSFLGLSSAFGMLPAIGIDAARLLFIAPTLFLGIFGGAVTELSIMFPGSGVYLGMILIIPLLVVCLQFVAALMLRQEI